VGTPTILIKGGKYMGRILDNIIFSDLKNIFFYCVNFIGIIMLIHLLVIIISSSKAEEKKKQEEENEYEEYIKKIRKILVESNAENIPKIIWELKKQDISEVRNFYFKLLTEKENFKKNNTSFEENNIGDIVIQKVKGETIINGKIYDGKDIEISNGKIFIDGKFIDNIFIKK